MAVSGAETDIERLSALRDRIASEIDATTEPNVLAVLSRQFLAVLAELASLQPATLTRTDEIAQKYSQKLAVLRGSDTPDKAPTRRKKQSG